MAGSMLSAMSRWLKKIKDFPLGEFTEGERY